jgi:hypothetical protein
VTYDVKENHMYSISEGYDDLKCNGLSVWEEEPYIDEIPGPIPLSYIRHPQQNPKPGTVFLNF